MLYTALLFGLLLLGLILLATGAVLLLKVNNKLPGLFAIAAGLLFTVSPIGVLLALTIVRTTS